jgi:beta-glucosidase
MPWFNDVDAVLLTWFGGQQMGSALADVIFGAVNPSGHTTTTWAKSIKDVPVLNTTPQDGALQYSEGVYIGYRAWQKSGVAPLIPFGHGLSYTTFQSQLLHADRLTAKVTVTNTGSRFGSEVVQIYARSASDEKFARRLAGFAKVSLKPGESTTIDVELEPLVFKKFDRAWRDTDGQWEISLAPHAMAEGQTITTL